VREKSRETTTNAKVARNKITCDPPPYAIKLQNSTKQSNKITKKVLAMRCALLYTHNCSAVNALCA